MKNFRTIGSVGVVAIIATILIFFVWSSIKENSELDDFNKTKQEFQSGNYSKIFDMSKDYYTRKDFYPLTFGDQKATYGYGAYPGEVKVKVTGFTTGNKFDSYTYVHSSPSVYTYQGMKLIMITPSDDLFDVKVEPSDILLSPAPLDNWTHKIKVTIGSKKDIPKGEYVFKLKVEEPSSDKEMIYRNLSEQEKWKYVGMSPIQPDKFFNVILNVDKS